MKKNILLLLTLLSFARAGYAGEFCCIDLTNFYAKLLTGVNFLEDTKVTRNKAKYDTGYIIGGSLGYYWCHGLRVEGEYAFRKNEISTIHFFGGDFAKHGYFKTSSIMANLFWDVPMPLCGCAFWDIQPFLGAGIGYDFQKMHASNSLVGFHQTWRHFSWQLMAGLAYPIFCNTDLTVEYRFHQGGCHFNNHTLGIGLVYKFE